MATGSDGVIVGQRPPGVPHLRIPFSLATDGTAETVAQGTSAEIVQCVANLVGTRPGTRFALPGYGITDPTFSGIDQVALHLAANKYEPRANVSVLVKAGQTEQVVVDVGGGTA